IILPPAALRPTKEFEGAVQYALQQTTDNEKFIELQNISEEYGYYYPYWIVTGGKFLCSTRYPPYGTPKKIIEGVIEDFIRVQAYKEEGTGVHNGEMYWKALGGDVSLLDGDCDIDGWLESTATRQVLITPFDVNPIYDLLEDEVSSEVQRIYTAQHHHSRPQVDSLIQTDNSTENALVRLSQTHGKVGVTKGVHFGGSLSEEDAVELVKETDITKWMRSVSIAGKPRIECMIRHTILGTSFNTHAFLPNDFSDGSLEDSAFVMASMDHHIESNGGELQPSTREMSYFVMYVAYRELVFDPKYIKGTDKFNQAIIKALDMKSDKEKYQELQKVFGRFGYFYPSSISLGGRMVYKVHRSNPSGVWPSNAGIELIDMLRTTCKDGDDSQIETIGGGSLFTGCQDWIDSIQTNQTRVQLRSLRPIYELLEDEQRTQVLKLYDENQNHVDIFPEIPKGFHFDGMDAEDQVIEFTKDRAYSKMIMLQKFSGRPNVDHVKRYMKGVENIEGYLSLDIDTDRELPGSVGFVSGSEGAYKEQGTIREHQCSKREAAYDVAYVTYKELNLYDEFIQPTNQFKEAINKALLVGKQDQETYYALQDVFQRFGYYYPSSVRIGSRIALCVSSQNQEDQHPTQDKDLQILFADTSKADLDDEPTIVEIPEMEADNQADTQLESDTMTVIKTEQSLSKVIVTNAIEKSLAKSEHWSSIGGDSVSLLLNDVKGWISTTESNQTVTQRRGLKPVYELLDDDQRRKVQQTYENIILEDRRIRYSYLLKLTSYENKLRRDLRNAPKANIIPMEGLLEKLLAQMFPDSNTAIQFCRTTCADYGFSVIEEEVTDQIIYAYCSRSALSKRTLHEKVDEADNKDEEDEVCICQWGVMLVKNEEAEWQFQKFTNEDESTHNHPETIRQPRRYRRGKAKPPTYINIRNIIIKPVVGPPMHGQGATDAHHVRYGDIVRLWALHENGDGGRFISASHDYIQDQLEEDEHVALQNELENAEFKSLWKVVPFSLSTDENDSETDGKENFATNGDYVRHSDLIMFESQAVIKGTMRLYLHLSFDCFVVKVVSGFKDPWYEDCGYYIEHMDQYAYLEDRKISQSDEDDNKQKIASVLEAISKEELDSELLLGVPYMYGLSQLHCSNAEALKNMQWMADDGYILSIHELGDLYWQIKEYQKAVETFEEAALFSVKSAYCKLGDIYRTGFSTPHQRDSYAITQNQRVAFMYYSIGGILGDATAALKIGEYYEKGHNEDFGVDHSKALQWYEYVSSQFKVPEATSAVGRITHILANVVKDPSKKDELRREAYKAFEAAAISDPYGKLMVAVYNLNGWGCQQPDPVLGFDMLLSLVETGVNMALHGIAKCYELGVGVERDRTKASAYQELAARMDAQ
ncbi:hypothetical protein DFQ30_010074, partial [Apophysomyces sp. BC1015]